MSLNSSLSQPQKKKKYVKANKNNDSVTHKPLPDNSSLSLDLSISEILPPSKTYSHQSQSIANYFQQTKSIIVQNNLHHDSNFRDCKPQFQEKELLKSLKKYIKKAFSEVKEIEIFYGKTMPTLKFQYITPKSNNQRRVRDLKELMKANKDLGQRQHDVIIKIFDQLYNRISSPQPKIQKFLKVLADRKLIELDFSYFKKTPLLYYEHDQKRIHFTFFDKNMRIFQFDSDVTQQLKFEEKELKHWSHFVSSLQQKRTKNQTHFDQFGQHQVSSGDQNISYEDTIGMQEAQNQIHQLLSADLTSYEQEIEELDCKCKHLQSKNDDKQKQLLQKLAEQQSQLYHNLQNFKEVKMKVEMRLKEKRDLNSTKNMLKQLIISQKQLHSRLPIVARKRQIFTRLDKSDLIILEGETGSGKSTQLPQMLCEYLGIFEADSTKKLPILITQPRRLATRTVAQRVASEMQQKIGGFVDYATSSYKPICLSAKIIFKLDSVVLDELTTDRRMSKYSCLIIDEAHQRTISIDVILGLVKQLQEIRKGFKVIVTSASLDAKLFEEYFKSKVMKVSGRLYPVEILYRPLAHQPDAVKKVQHIIKKEILLNNSQSKAEYKGDILVFCSGVDDINILCNLFDKYLNPKKFRVYALHGKIAVAEQREVFLQTKEQKVIFASRIAETSITINGVKVVIDPGFDRELIYDQRFRVSSRKLVNISQSSAKQRAGRAGRTSHGFCFRLYSEVELTKFRVNKTPQIDNMALDTLVLRLKSLSVDNIFTFRYVKSPDKQALQKSLETLQMIGGLNQSQEITTIGKLLLQLHIQPFLGRSIVEAIVLDYIVRQTKYIEAEYKQSFSRWQKQDLDLLKSLKQNVIEILCMVINSSNLFYSTIYTRQRLDEIKYTKFSSQKGDFFYLSNIYSQFYHLLKQDKNKLNDWLHHRFLNRKTLFQTKELIEEIIQIIKNFKFDPKDPAILYLIDSIKFKLKYCNNFDDAILSCMITSFCVNLCLYSENPKVGYTLVLQKKPVLVYGTSTLALQGLYPKWIVCYDLKTNDKGITYCQIAHEVHFDFLKLTVEDYVFKRLDLRQAEKMNPFYEKIEKKLPTAIIRQIQNEYANNENNNHPILKYLTYNVSEESNKIQLFYSKGLCSTDLNNTLINDSGLSIHDVINDYIQTTIRKKKHQKLVCNIISNIFVQFYDGFHVKSLYFTDMQVEFLVKGEKFILNQVRQLLEGVNAYPFGNMLKINTYNKEDQIAVRNVLNEYGLEYDDQKREKKQEKLSARIYMRFYTGKLKNEPLFMYYGKNEQKCAKMQRILQQFQQRHSKDSKNKSKYVRILCQGRFVESYKKTGIRCYNTNIDGFELKEALENLCITELPFDFQQPLGIQQFRTNQSSTVAARTSKQWEDEISRILAKHKLTNLSVVVQNQKPQMQRELSHNIQKYIKQQLTATITSHSLQAIDEMVKIFDGREGIIGEGKIHFRYNFKQLIVKVNKRVFSSLIEQFNYQKHIFQTTTNVKIQTYTKQFGKVSHTFITCRSPIRQNLLKPTEVISNLFTPYIRRMEVAHYNFLSQTDQGDRQLERIEELYGYRIQIGFIKKNHSLKIYCLDHDYQEVERRIDGIFKNHYLYIENIEYRGKGLGKVEQVLQNIMDQNDTALKKDKYSKLNINYKIIYKRREVQISGDLISINKAKKEIQNICNIKTGSCNLCNRDVQKPFKLINCTHEFCSKCLADYIDETKRDEEEQSNINGLTKSADLLCPYEGCGTKINPNDLQALLSTEQFESLSYRRVKQFVKTHKQYFFCPTAKCEQIFEHNKIKEKPSFECVICGRWFCSSCKQPHQHFTCDQWSRKLEKNQLLSFGFKKCHCGYIIQKQQKGKMIRCKSCNEYLCWRCNKSWRLQKTCQEHIKNCTSR